MISKSELKQALEKLGLQGQCVCIHSSLGSFGEPIEGGPRGLLQLFLELGCTVMVPAAADDFLVKPPLSMRPERNGAGDYSFVEDAPERTKLFTPDCNDITVEEMGIFPYTVVNTPGRARGGNPIFSFCAVGPRAEELVKEQTPLNIWAPLDALCRRGGKLLLMGVGLERATMIHYAETLAGRQSLLRWVSGPDGRSRYCREGGCSEGFGKLEPAVKPAETDITVGKSLWRLFPAAEFARRCAAAIREDPGITHCGDPECVRCSDSVLGGPVLPKDLEKYVREEMDTMTSWKNLDRLENYEKLQKLPKADVKKALSGPEGAERVKAYSLPMAGGLSFNYAARPVDGEILEALADLAKEAQLSEKYRELLNGAVINTGEKRLVLHQLTRGQQACDVTVQGVNKREFYLAQQEKIRVFAEKVHRGEIVNEKGEAFTAVVQVGIGGSDLGPRAMVLALENWAKAQGLFKMEAKFISNVDPDDAVSVLDSVDLAHSLFIVVSKSGTTLETLTNEAFVKDALVKAGLKPSAHMLAVTSETSPMAKSSDYLAAFFMDDYIGGRYSSCSAVGGAVMSLAFGPEVFARFLDGAAAEDRLALEEDPLKNADMLDALLGVYERNILGMPSTAVLPYSQALSRFPAHLQQLDMESNGKSVNRFGEPVNYPTGPVIFGEPGTNGQHSFYQLLHQGTDLIPLQFVGFKANQTGKDVDIQGSSSQQKLCANVAAQIMAFACGKEDENRNKYFAGGRPSSIIIGEQLTPESLGALLAHFENKVMFQGFLWNLNSFDQEGVQLGKVLAKKVLARETEGALAVYSELLGI